MKKLTVMKKSKKHKIKKEKFEPCDIYPICKSHKCDCYETYCMLNSK